MNREKRKFSAEFKVKVLREHFENHVAVGKICEEYNIHPNLFYLWKKDLFQGALKTFSKQKNNNSEEERLSKLEEKIKDKDSIISEIVEDNLRLKKKLSGEI
ncbi:MAG TPA: transposase [Candidatus Paceibacterota bacterium]|nr:transposase [Candidatus Paceibacterota bacterium]